MQEVSFDAWGARRSPSDWLSPPAGIAALRAITPRGFTGHEHIDHAGIVHMNGRIYDPVLGRFLQADPVVQAPDNSQNLNRYTYVLNNPLSYTDPSGFFFKSIGNFIGKFWQPILAIAVTVVSAGVATGALFASLEIAGTSAAWGVAIGGGALAGLVNAGNLRGALYGAFSAAAFHGVGTYFSNIKGAAAKNLGRFGNFVKDNLRLTKTIAHGLTGGIMNELQGGKFAHGFLSAGATQALAPSIESIGIGDGALSFGDRALRVASAAALGGAVSEVTGGKFANGAVTGAFSRAFNDESIDDLLKRQEAARAEVDAAYESGDLSRENSFASRDEAAKAVLSVIEPISVRHRVELGGYIFKSDGRFSYAYPHVGRNGSIDLNLVPEPDGAVAGYHSHPNGARYFSYGDVNWVNGTNGSEMPLYLIGRGQVRVCGVGSAFCDSHVARHFDYSKHNRGLRGQIVE